jgi:hypothetical protein
MKIERTDISTAAARKPQGEPPAEALKGRGFSCAPSPDAVKAPEPDSRELATMQALVNGLRGDFAEIGMVPPPRNFAGMSLVTQTELTQADKAPEEAPRPAPAVGTLDKMRIIMVKNILSRMAVQESATAEGPAAGQISPAGGTSLEHTSLDLTL